jgi:integral membrane sensor domain MASE1
MNSPVSLIVRIVALAIAYYVVGRIGLMLAISPGYATIIWPPSGIALGALIVWGSAVWPGVVIGSFVLNVAVSAGTHSLASLSPAPGLSRRQSRAGQCCKPSSHTQCCAAFSVRRFR